MQSGSTIADEFSGVAAAMSCWWEGGQRLGSNAWQQRPTGMG
jgi:hypothetical protein